MKRSSIISILLCILLLPVIVLAGGEEDDRVFTTTFEEGYEYGNVKKCNTSSGVAWFVGIKTANNVQVCLWNTKDKVGADSFSCEDSEMERFTLGEVKDNNGVEYWGYGCRKVKDESKIEYIKKELYVGYGEQLGAYTGYTCTIIEGDAIEFNKHNACYVDAKKAGSAKVKVVNNQTKDTKYYEYTVISPDEDVLDLDDNYYYGSVNECKLGSAGYTFGDKVTFDNLTFCASSAAGYNYELYKVSCANEGYETFKLTFKSNGTSYKGYGCRKIKDESKIEYTKKELYVGYGEQVASQYSNKCTITSGSEYAEFNDMNACYLDAKKAGIVKIKVINNNSGAASYFEYTIKEAATDTTELDDKYKYASVDKCNLWSGGHNLGGKVKFNGLTFCASSLPGYNYEKTEVTCKNSSYEIFKLTFSVDGKNYKGYGCRKLKSDDDNESSGPTIKEQNCESLLGDSKTEGTPAFYLVVIFKVLKYVAIILLLVMSIMDFVGAVASQDNDILKKAVSKLIKRAILCVIIFILPTLIEFVLNIIHESATESCNIW